MDIQTLLISNASHLLLYFFALLLITAFATRPGLRWFAASYGFLAVGNILVAGRGYFSPFLSIVVANLCILFGFVLQHKGALDFLDGGRKHLSLALATVPATVPWLIYYTYRRESTTARIVVISLALAFTSALTSSVLFPRSRGVRSRRAVALVMASYSALNLLRAVITIWLGAPMDFLHRDRFQALSMLCSDLMICALLLGFTWMMNARLQTELEYAANMDSLTGVMNRRAIEAVLKREILRSNYLGQVLTLLLLDVDNFKKINDSRGHAAGDEVLKRVAEGIVAELRVEDKVARWGGEEFCCLLSETCLEDGLTIAERLRKSLAGMSIDLGDKDDFQLTVSIGVTDLKSSDTAFTLVRRADDALYKAKRSGKNCVCFGEADASESLENAIGHA